MIAQPFVLAVPQRWKGGGEIATCAELDQLRSNRPCLWLAPGTRSMPLASGGYILGVLFRGGRICQARELDEAPGAHRSLPAGVRWLARECWGAYTAVGIDPEDSEVWVFPDPSGLLPVYRMADAGHILITSNPQLFAGAGLAPAAVDWTALADHLRFPELRQRQTRLAGVTELAPGALHPVQEPAESPLVVWRPDIFMPTGAPVHAAEAAAALRSRAVETLGAWAALAGPVAVAASGGVDSSLICAALAVSGRQFDCITLATADPSGDERRFAAALGRHLGVRLRAAIYDPADAAPSSPASLGLPRPSRRLFMRALDKAFEGARLELGARAVFDGNSGDNLFCFLHSAAPVVDPR